MIEWSFNILQMSPQAAMEIRPGLPLIEEFQHNSESLQIFLEKVELAISRMDREELEIIAEGHAVPRIPIYVTYGIQPLYDAWTTSENGETKIFLNADGFQYNFENDDALIVIHELVHLLIADELPQINEKDYLGHYLRMMVDEGLAHFVSFPYRDKLLNYQEHYLDKWQWAEKKFRESQRILSSDATDEEKDKILVEGNTGSYWMKHASIYGMFLFSEIFKNGGIRACLQKLKEFSKCSNLSPFISKN